MPLLDKSFQEYGDMLTEIVSSVLLASILAFLVFNGNDVDDDDDHQGGKMIPAYNPIN